MKRSIRNSSFLFFFVFFCLIMNVSAATKQVSLTTGVNIRKGPGTNYGVIITGGTGSKFNLKSETVVADEPKNGDCNNGWYQIDYNGQTGYVCTKYATINDPDAPDIYGRPWTTPKKAIVGGARFIASSYIAKGQFNSYLKKFNVNPNSAYNIYGHQYMANLAAPKSEAARSYNSYKNNNLLSLPLEFTIPIYNNMPEYTALPGTNPDKTCQSEVTDANFEALLDAEKFPESFKCKLRLLHNEHPNWTFKAMPTNLDFNASVRAEKAVSSIQGNSAYYDMSSGAPVSTEPNWYRANDATVGYYLDTRNFLNETYILMFENLAYSEQYTEEVVSSILKNTFMSGLSVLDNETYASIFVSAGRSENVSAVYLASLSIQEIGTKVSSATNGAEFTYKDITYKGVYNFFNIGAYSSESNPSKAGLVYAAGGSDSVIVSGNTNSGSSSTIAEPVQNILTKLDASLKQNCLTNIKVGTTLSKLKSTLSDMTVSVSNTNDNDILKTGSTITINDSTATYTYTIVILGDVDGDGNIGATDYVKIKNYIMEKSGSELNIAQSVAADIDNNGTIGATDYVKIKNSIMEG